MPSRPSLLEDQIGQWRAYLRRQRAIDAADVEALEARLRDQVRVLTVAGLDDEEAFLVAVKRVGSADPRARAFARAHSDRLWKQLVMGVNGRVAATVTRAETLVVFALAVAAALAIKDPGVVRLDD